MMAMTHDEVYDLAFEAGAIDLACYMFATEQHAGCNGIWAIEDTATDTADAKSRIADLMRGHLPKGIEAHNDVTRNWLLSRQPECSHSWHLYGTIDGREDWGCQLCGARI